MTGQTRWSKRTSWADGQPISALMSLALTRTDLISLAAGFVDQVTLPAQATRTALDALYADQADVRAALQYGTTAGDPTLRQLLLERQLGQDGAGGIHPNISTDRIVCTAGSNQLLHLVSECLLNPGDLVLCAAPTYLVYLGTLANLGAQSMGVPTDEQGMIPAGLEETLVHLDRSGRLSRVKVIYLVSYSDNPAGVTMPRQRRQEIVQIAKRWSARGRIHIIEDTAYRELHYDGEEIPSLWSFDEDGDTVILAGSFSKSFSPGIRVGWGILPRHLVKPVCNLKGNIDFGSPNFSQRLITKVLQLGLFDSHIKMLRVQYRNKLDTMLVALKDQLGTHTEVQWLEPSGGLYVWLTLPQSLDAGPGGRLLEEVMNQGMLYVPGQYCYPPDGVPVCKNTIRLSFGVQENDGIRRGVQALGRALQRVESESEIGG